ncbi:MAG: hypothetical protein OXC41_09735 [Gammaproteobacteria bacterium]|nr:hypothetical protein [Gammaproteobacteria bacterium]
MKVTAEVEVGQETPVASRYKVIGSFICQAIIQHYWSHLLWENMKGF